VPGGTGPVAHGVRRSISVPLSTRRCRSRGAATGYARGTRSRASPSARSAGCLERGGDSLHGSQRVGGIELPEVARLDQEPGRIPRRSSRRQAISVIRSPVPSIPAESSTRQGPLWRRRRAARVALVLGGRDQPLAEILLFERRTLEVPGRVEARRTFYLGIRTAP
jgi:hypothetical protein